jgi:hypothetical protein
MEKNTRRKVALGSLVAGVAVLIAISALAAALSAPTVVAGASVSYTCSIDPTLTKGSGQLNVLNAATVFPGGRAQKTITGLTWKAVNDEDSGFVGYWAMDTYTSVLNVWEITAGAYAGDYYFTQTFSGDFQTPQGATSPNGTSELASGYGTLLGAEIGNITGATFTVSPGNLTSGNMGDLNYGGSVADLLLGSYGNGQTGDSNAYNWYATYFGNSGSITYNWGFDYNLNAEFTTNSNGGSHSANQWCNWDTGADGDIVTAA